MTETKIDIGILEDKSNALLHPRFFPSKVGGKPAWLNLRDLPDIKNISCLKCGEPLLFLCQVYAPYEESEDCFHRTIFIFICQNGSCCRTNSSDNFIVLRCQIPRKNDFYNFEPYQEQDEDFCMDKWSRLCNVCGLKGPSHCSKCKKVYYCSRKHQIIDWQKEHKELCGKIQAGESICRNDFKITTSGKTLLFKEWELVVDEEDEECNTSTVDVSKEMEKLKKLMQEKKAGTLSDIPENELEQYAQSSSKDKIFNKFNKRIARHPEQVLRYDRGGAPLWITGNSGAMIHVPKCEYCQAERQFEFQIMPQLLNFIDVGIELNSIDWGVLVIYTCKDSCSGGPAYKKEFLIKQDLIQ